MMVVEGSNPKSSRRKNRPRTFIENNKEGFEPL
jgi:hypothetical protein